MSHWGAARQLRSQGERAMQETPDMPFPDMRCRIRVVRALEREQEDYQ